MIKKLSLALLMLIAMLGIAAVTANISLEQYLEGAEPAPSADHVNSILKADVFAYFELESEYGTPLKKSNFKSTKEYKVLADSLAVVKKELLKKTFYVVEEVEFEEFNLQAGKLKANTNNSDFAPYSFHDPRVVDGYLFEKLPFGKENVLGANWYSRSFQMTAKEAENLEDGTCKVYIIFKVTGSKKVKFSSPRMYAEHDGPYADKFKVVITPAKGNEAYFVRDFVSTQAKKK